MDPDRQKIQDDLRGLLAGDIRCDDVFMQMYSTDASLHEVPPLGVVRPRHAADVVSCVQYAAEHQIPLHARGAGTGLAGGSLGTGLVIDFSKYMRRVVGVSGDTARVQPGVVHAHLNRQLAPQGKIFGPDPAMSPVTTMGGVVSVDASGSRWLKYGSARHHVRGLEVVLASGRRLRLRREKVSDIQGNSTDATLRRELGGKVKSTLERSSEDWLRHRPRSLVNTAGYQLDGVLDGEWIDLPKLLCGSEGTLALITEIEVGLQRVSSRRGVALLFFDRLEKAAQAVQAVVSFGPSACDLIDRRHLRLAMEAEPLYHIVIPNGAEAALMVEIQGDDPLALRDTLWEITDCVRRSEGSFETRHTMEPEEVELYWQLARRVVAVLHGMKGFSRPVPFVEDVAVPPEALPEFLVDVQNLLKRRQIIATLFAHAGHGQIHLRPMVDLSRPEEVTSAQNLAEELYSIVLQSGGTISGEHGDGLSRTRFLQKQYGPLFETFREIKRIFDPHNILNPGKVVSDTARPLEMSLRMPPDRNGETTPKISLQLHWDSRELADSTQSCNGCGTCRVQKGDARMCPVFHITSAEEASPRAKANLMRGILSGRLEPDVVSQGEMKNVADLCVHCHMCRVECPAGVNIPKLMLEAKAAYVATHGLSFSDWLLARLDLLSAWGSQLPSLSNWLIGHRIGRLALGRLLWLAPARKLPRFANRSYLSLAARQRLTRPTRRSGSKVLYFLDLQANYFDPPLAESLVSILEHHGIAVYVHPKQLPSGMSMISQGLVEPARKMAAKNVALLADAVRQGYDIIVSEPSAAICLKHEYPQLLGDQEARLVAEHTTEACTYLWRLHQNGKLSRDLRPLNLVAGYHLPCHVRALGSGVPGEGLLRLIPELRVNRIEKGCSGMAGVFGLKRENYRTSLRAGWGLISELRQPSVQVGTTECTACKIQMEQGTSKPTIHPLKLLALSYGLKPELASLLTTRSQELTIT